ncbi:MAG: uroporphyrinogen-III synthase [Pseudohongiellaceae bacterium]
MNSASLSGLVVLITRPSNQISSTQLAIESAGAETLSLPLIEIQALTDESALRDLQNKVLKLDSYHCLIFVSNNAVNFGAEVINNYWPQFPLGVEVVAVGPTTAEAARQQLACPVTHAPSGMTSEDVLQLAQLQDISDKKIGIVRGQGGRELLAETLRSRGATVDYLEAYSRKPVKYESSKFCEALTNAGVNVLSVSSGESLDRLTAQLVAKSEAMLQLDLVVPSERVALQAIAAGYKKVHNARGADPGSFVAALGELVSNQE